MDKEQHSRTICSHYYGWVVTGDEHLIGGWPNAPHLEEWLRSAFRCCRASFSESLKDMGVSLAMLDETEMWFYETCIGDGIRSIDVVMMLIIK